MALEQNNQPVNEMRFSYGGQAVIEGVMMRGAHDMAVAVRDPEGQIVIHEQPLNATLYRGRIAKMPFVRGIIGLWDALGLGIRALLWSADVALGEEEASFNGPIGWITVAFSLVLGIGLFFVLPVAASSGLGNLLGYAEVEGQNAISGGFDAFFVNILEGLVRLVILVVYIWFVGRTTDGKRIFSYHGAEHKTINAYEAGADLTPEVVQSYPIEHPRCGTAFLLTVVFVSILLFGVLGRPVLPLLILSRIILIPVIAGVAYEFLKFTAKNMHNPIIRIIVKPNLALQHLTTNEPNLDMIEVAITSFKRVLLSEGLIQEEEAQIPPANPEAAYSPGGD